jgi:acylphosphatase
VIVQPAISRSVINNIVIPPTGPDLNSPYTGRERSYENQHGWSGNEDGEHLIWRIPILITMIRITACAKGRVQGVGYRYHVTDCARETGVSGFVRNAADGSVLIVAEGRDDAVSEFVRMVKAHGDPIIRVDTMEVIKSDPTGEFSGFGIRW